MRTISHHWKENGHALACPYCSAGMCWDFQDRCWLCILCGYREHDRVLQLKSMVEIVTVRVWDEIFGHLDKKRAVNIPLSRD